MIEYYGNNDYRDYLIHYGVLGMRWGVRRYQPYSVRGRKSGKTGKEIGEANKNTINRSIIRLQKAAKTKKEVDSIINTMSNKELEAFGIEAGSKEYLTIQQGEHVLHRSLKKVNGEPVSFFDLLDDGDEIQLALGTKAGKHRGKGYAKEVSQEAMEWLDEHPKIRKDRDVIWGVKESNKASIAIAKSLDFREDINSHRNGWVNYVNEDKYKASHLANEIYSLAMKKEPVISKDVRAASDAAGNHLHGFDNRLKTEDSITRKIITDSVEKEITKTNAAESIKDSVRYTTISSDRNFVNDYKTFKEYMESKGYEETRCKNYFKLYDEGKVKHKSVQSIFTDSDGFSFEVQFHTPSSQNAKDKKVPIYEERRRPGLSEDRQTKLEKKMTKLAEKVKNPRDIYSIKTHG